MVTESQAARVLEEFKRTPELPPLDHSMQDWLAGKGIIKKWPEGNEILNILKNKASNMLDSGKKLNYQGLLFLMLMQEEGYGVSRKRMLTAFDVLDPDSGCDPHLGQYKRMLNEELKEETGVDDVVLCARKWGYSIGVGSVGLNPQELRLLYALKVNVGKYITSAGIVSILRRDNDREMTENCVCVYKYRLVKALERLGVEGLVIESASRGKLSYRLVES